MKLKKLEEALEAKRPLYIVRLQEYTVKKAEKDPNVQRARIRDDLLTSRKVPIRYTMPVVRQVYLTKIDVLADRGYCIAPIPPFKEPFLPEEDPYDESNLKPISVFLEEPESPESSSINPQYCYIDYGKVPLKRIYATYENADAFITPELISRFIKPEFVKKYPQILLYHKKLAEMYPDGADAIVISDSDEVVKDDPAEESLRDQMIAALKEIRSQEQID